MSKAAFAAAVDVFEAVHRPRRPRAVDDLDQSGVPLREERPSVGNEGHVPGHFQVGDDDPGVVRAGHGGPVAGARRFVAGGAGRGEHHGGRHHDVEGVGVAPGPGHTIRSRSAALRRRA